MTHDLIRQCFCRAMPKWDDIAEDVDEGEDYRLMMKRKTYRSKMVLQNPEKREDLILLSLSTIPLDHLFTRLEYLDARGGLLYDLSETRSSPLAECSRALFQVVGGNTGAFAEMFDHFDETTDRVPETTTKARVMMLEMAAHLWWRSWRYSTWPYRLLRAVNPMTQHNSLRVFEQLYDASPCCLDDHFSLKLRACYSSARAMDACPILKVQLQTWARKGRVVNMHIERLLALIKKAAVVSQGQKPDITRLASAGLLTQWRRLHSQSGGMDFSSLANQRQHVLSRGAPVRKRPREQDPNKCRGHISWINEQVKQARENALANNLQWKKEDRDRAQTAAAQRFRVMPLNQKTLMTMAAKEERRAKRQVASENASSRAQIDVARRQHGRCLWQVSTEGTPVRLEDIAEPVRE